MPETETGPEYQPEDEDGHDEYHPEHEDGHDEYHPEHEDGRDEYQPEHEDRHDEYQPEFEAGQEYQPEDEDGHDEYHPEHEDGHDEYHPEHEDGRDEYQPEHEDRHDEYQPEFEAGQEYQPEMEAEHEYESQNESEEETDPEEEGEEEEEEEEDGEEEGADQEYQPEHEGEEGYQPEHVTEEEYQPANESELVQEQDQEHELRDEDNGIDVETLENSHPDNKLENATEPVAVAGDRWPGWPGESVFRMLVPAQKVGGIIGRKGEYIKKTCEETKARIKILDGPPGSRERAVIVSAKEDPDAPCPPAVDGLLRVHMRVLDGLENDSSVPTPSLGGKVSTRLLVPAAQAGSLIGKQGATVKSIQEESGCNVRVLGTEELPVFALQDDRAVEVVGEATGIHKALELIATHLRKFLVDRSVISVIEMQMQAPTNPPMDQMPPSQQHWGPSPQSFPQGGGPGYGASPRFMTQSRQYDNYYPSADIPPPEKQHQGISAYGREAPISVHSVSGPAPTSVITQVTQQMQIPLSYADAVIGAQGSSISYIRRVSGATVTIQETRGVPTEMTVEISGTASQVQTAQQLIQNSMAQAAAGSTQQQNPPSAADQMMYSSYGSAYASSASNPPQTGGYSSAYGNNYGY